MTRQSVSGELKESTKTFCPKVKGGMGLQKNENKYHMHFSVCIEQSRFVFGFFLCYLALKKYAI